jgi:membrane-associated phospholipid phosphatase
MEDRADHRADARADHRADHRGAVRADAEARTGSTLAGALDDPAHQRYVGGRDLTRWPSAAGRLLLDLALRLRLRLAPHEVLAVTLAVGFALTAVLTALAGGVYDSVTEADGVALLDRPALSAVVAARSPVGNDVAAGYAFVGGGIGMSLLATVVTVGLALRWRRWTPVVLVAVTAAGSLTLTAVGKAVVGRTRPPLADAIPPFEHSPSFPSGHSLNSIAIAIAAYLLVREQRSARARALTVTLAAAFAVTMGLSRVYLGAHWLSDVLVAWALGLAWLTVVVVAHRLFLTLRPPAH